MRKPRDIDAELRALQDKAKALKAKQRLQNGELVSATGADMLDPETLAGVLLEAVERAKADATAKEAWRDRGQGFFRRGGKGRKAPDQNLGGTTNPDGGGPETGDRSAAKD